MKLMCFKQNFIRSNQLFQKLNYTESFKFKAPF